MSIQQLRPLTGLALLLCSLACVESGPSLTEERRALTSPTQVSELLGFSLAQALPRHTGVAQLTWGEGRDGVEFVPTATSTELHWELNLPETSSEAFSIDEVDVECDLSRISTNTNMCDDRLEASLLAHLETSDGALAEDVPVVLSAHTLADVSWLNRRLDLSALNGGFSIVAHEGVANTLQVGVSGALDAHGSSGALMGDVVMQREVSNNGHVYSETGAVLMVASWHEGTASDPAAGNPAANDPAASDPATAVPRD